MDVFVFGWDSLKTNLQPCCSKMFFLIIFGFYKQIIDIIVSSFRQINFCVDLFPRIQN